MLEHMRCDRCGDEKGPFVEMSLWNPGRNLVKAELLCGACSQKFMDQMHAATVASWN